MGETRQWCDAPLFPLVLRRCGYNVVFLSNQFAGAEMDKRFNASMGFFNDPRIASLLFDYRGTRTFAYDEQLVTYYEQQRKRWNSPSVILSYSTSMGSTSVQASVFPKAILTSSQATFAQH